MKIDENLCRLERMHKSMEDENEKRRQRFLYHLSVMDAKQALQLEIEQKRGALQVMKQMEEINVIIHEKMDAIFKELMELEGKLKAVGELNVPMTVREQECTQEIEEAHVNLIKIIGLEGKANQIWRDVSETGRIWSYPGGLNLEYSVEYWLTLDLL